MDLCPNCFCTMGVDAPLISIKLANGINHEYVSLLYIVLPGYHLLYQHHFYHRWSGVVSVAE